MCLELQLSESSDRPIDYHSVLADLALKEALVFL
jgi:hypothetical protein